MKNLLIALIVLFFAARAQATTYWASTSGGAGSCAAASGATDPKTYRTLAQGVACLAAGDTLMIKGGTYAQRVVEPISGNSAASPTIVRGAVGETVTLTGNPSVPDEGPIGLSAGKNNITFQHLILDGTTQTAAAHGIFVDSSTTNISVIDLEVRNMSAGSGIFTAAVGFLAQNVWVHHNGSSCSSGPGLCHGIYLGGSFQTVTDSIFEYNETYGIHQQYSGGHNVIKNNIVRLNPAGIAVGGGGNNYAYNNLVYGNTSTEAHGINVGGMADATGPNFIYNNTVVNNGGYGIRIYKFNSPGSQIRNNIALGNSDTQIGLFDQGDGTCTDCTINTNVTTGTINNIFVNAATGDFHLLNNATTQAAVIGKGAVFNSIFSTDYANTTRGTAWDIGAYEYVATGAPPVVVINQPAGCSGSSSACTTTNETVTLGGTATAGGAAISQVQWLADRPTPSTGTTAAITPWQTSLLTLKSGVNNISVTATDSNNNTGTDSIAITYAPTFPGNTLAGAWAMEENTGTTVADQSTNSNTATLVNGATWTTGHATQGISLNGVNQYLSVNDANSLDYTQGFTFSIWLKPNALHTDNRVAMTKSSYMVLYASQDGTYCTSGGPAIWFNANGTSGPAYFVCYPTPLQIGVWSHLAATYDGTTLTLYLNGVAVGTPKLASGYMEPTTGVFRIGASLNGEFFHGTIDEARTYNWGIPRTAGSNTVPNTPCVTSDLAPSIVRDMNCAIIPLPPPLKFEISATTTFAIGASTTFAIGTQ